MMSGAVGVCQCQSAAAGADGEEGGRHPPARVPKKPALHPGQPLEVDLHAGQLFDSTEGLEAKDILEAQMRKFGEIMDRHIKQKGFKIVFIHGKGNGVLRQEIIKTLKYKYKSCLYQDASFREYGFGATLVTIK